MSFVPKKFRTYLSKRKNSKKPNPDEPKYMKPNKVEPRHIELKASQYVELKPPEYKYADSKKNPDHNYLELEDPNYLTIFKNSPYAIFSRSGKLQEVIKPQLPEVVEPQLEKNIAEYSTLSPQVFKNTNVDQKDLFDPPSPRSPRSPHGIPIENPGYVHLNSLQDNKEMSTTKFPQFVLMKNPGYVPLSALQQQKQQPDNLVFGFKNNSLKRRKSLSEYGFQTSPVNEEKFGFGSLERRSSIGSNNGFLSNTNKRPIEFNGTSLNRRSSIGSYGFPPITNEGNVDVPNDSLKRRPSVSSISFRGNDPPLLSRNNITEFRSNEEFKNHENYLKSPDQKNQEQKMLSQIGLRYKENRYKQKYGVSELDTSQGEHKKTYVSSNNYNTEFTDKNEYINHEIKLMRQSKNPKHNVNKQIKNFLNRLKNMKINTVQNSSDRDPSEERAKIITNTEFGKMQKVARAARLARK